MTGYAEDTDRLLNGRAGLLEVMSAIKDGAGDIAPLGLSIERLLELTEREGGAS